MILSDLALAVLQDPDFSRYHSSVEIKVVQSEIERYFKTRIGSKTETGQDILYMALTICDVDKWEVTA